MKNILDELGKTKVGDIITIKFNINNEYFTKKVKVTKCKDTPFSCMDCIFKNLFCTYIKCKAENREDDTEVYYKELESQ